MIEIVVAYVTLKVKWGPDKSRTELCSRVFHSFCDLEFDESSITLSILSGASLVCFVDDLVPLVCVLVVLAVVVEVELSSWQLSSPLCLSSICAVNVPLKLEVLLPTLLLLLKLRGWERGTGLARALLPLRVG